MRALRRGARHSGAAGELAQLGERLVCNQEVTGSSPVFSTNLRAPGRESGTVRAGRDEIGEPGQAGLAALEP
jgi:hypothetical protein